MSADSRNHGYAPPKRCIIGGCQSDALPPYTCCAEHMKPKEAAKE